MQIYTCIMYWITGLDVYKRQGEDLAQQKKLEKALNIAYHEKQICVSQKKCIKDLKVWYNGEDEVI